MDIPTNPLKRIFFYSSIFFKNRTPKLYDVVHNINSNIKLKLNGLVLWFLGLPKKIHDAKKQQFKKRDEAYNRLKGRFKQ